MVQWQKAVKRLNTAVLGEKSHLSQFFTTIQPVKTVCDLVVQLDSELSMKTHVSKGRQQLFLPAGSFMADQMSRRSGSRGQVGLCADTFPAGLL